MNGSRSVLGGLSNLSTHVAPGQKDGAADLASSMRHRGAAVFRSVGSIRIPEFVLFALMVADVVPLAHAGEVFLALMVGIALFRRPDCQLGPYAVLVPIFAVALTYIGIVSLMLPPEEGAADWRFRLIRIAAVSAMAFFVATGRIDLRSGVLGVVAVAIVNIPLFYAGLLSNE